MTSTQSSTRSYQNSIFPQLSEEDQKHIDAIRPHFIALNRNYTSQQIYALLKLDQRSSWSSSGTRSSTPSTSFSFDFHSSSNASLRSSITSITSAGTSNYAQSIRSSAPYSQPETHNANVDITRIDSKPEVWSPPVTREASDVSDSGRPPLCCPFPGHEKSTFRRKGDFKDHMDRYHKPGPNAWECQQKGCERQFETELLFRQHHASDHRCRRSCMHADQSKTSVPLKLAFACGFEGCTGLFNNWDNWRDHVRDHLWSGASVSSCQYTVEFRNLLRRREISSLWNSRVEQQRRAPQGYQQGFLWEPSTSSHLKKHLEFSSLHCEREELVDYIFRAGVRAPPQREQRELQQQLAHSTNINLPLTSLSTTTDFSIPESNAVQSLTMSNLAGDSSFQAPAYDVSYNLDQFSFQFTTQQPQTSFDPMVNSGPGLASDFAQSPFPPSWSDDEAMNLHAPSTNNIPHELENQSGPQRDFWYPNVPNDPLAAYGLPPDATNPHVSSSKVETQHTRTKSSGTNSLAKKISGYFSSGRKSTHSRSDSDNSDQRMGGMQAYY